jgi:hypothetical protein
MFAHGGILSISGFNDAFDSFFANSNLSGITCLQNSQDASMKISVL